MIKFGDEYKEESKEYLHNHCMLTLQKYEPRIKICRLNLKRTLIKMLSERKAPDQDIIEKLKAEMDEVSIDGKKNIIFSKVFSEMQKVYKWVTDLSVGKDNTEEIMVTDEAEKVAMELIANMYKGLKHDCWNLDDVAHNEIIDVEYKKKDESKTETEVEVDIVQNILEHNSANKEIQTIVDAKQAALKRVAILAKLSKIDDAGVLIKLAGYAGFGDSDEKVTENLFLTLEEIFRCWALDPPELEKIVANKILSF